MTGSEFVKQTSSSPHLRIKRQRVVSYSAVRLDLRSPLAQKGLGTFNSLHSFVVTLPIVLHG